MPGDDWQKFANLRALFGYMFAHPGKKMLFMGQEIGQWDEWNHDSSIDWHLLQWEPHRGMQKLVQDLNSLYRRETALFNDDFSANGFEWIDINDWESSIISFLRKGPNPNDTVVIVCNFTPVPRHNYNIGVPVGGYWKELMNTDAKEYWGSGMGNFGGVQAKDTSSHGRPYTLTLTLPPLSVVFFKPGSF
jgi:1,4-alpha-glucan branching enzyme